MTTLAKYLMVLAFGLVIGLCVKGSMSVELVARLARLDGTAVVAGDTSARARLDAPALLVDATGAIGPNEELDYLIATRTGTLAGWQAFLSVHATGRRAQSAASEIDKLMLRIRASGPTEADVPPRSAPESKGAVVTASFDRDSDGAARPLDDVLGFDGRPASGDDSAPVADLSAPEPPLAEVASLEDRPPTAGSRADAKPRAPALRKQAAAAPSHAGRRPRLVPCAFGLRCRWGHQTLPPFLQALYGIKPSRPIRVADASLVDPRRR